MAQVDAAKVETWCEAAGVFFFTSHAEALEYAGRAVAEAWKSARASVGVGLRSSARALFWAEEVGQSSADGPSGSWHELLPSDGRPHAGVSRAN